MLGLYNTRVPVTLAVSISLKRLIGWDRTRLCVSGCVRIACPSGSPFPYVTWCLFEIYFCLQEEKHSVRSRRRGWLTTHVKRSIEQSSIFDIRHVIAFLHHWLFTAELRAVWCRRRQLRCVVFTHQLELTIVIFLCDNQLLNDTSPSDYLSVSGFHTFSNKCRQENMWTSAN